MVLIIYRISFGTHFLCDSLIMYNTTSITFYSKCIQDLLSRISIESFIRFCKISSYDFAYVESACMSQNQKLKFDDIQGIYISFINHTYIVKLILSIASGEFLEVIYRWSYRKSALSELCICL